MVYFSHQKIFKQIFLFNRMKLLLIEIAGG
jgi:hypothetical protein